PFAFPREYFFPAFYTRQTNLNTLHAQLVKWSSLVLSYCRHYRIFKLSLSPIPSSSSTTSTTTSTSPSAPPPLPPPTITSSGVASTDVLFHNPRLNRRLALADIREVIAFMRKEGRAEYLSDGGGDVVWIYWRTPEEWAALVEAWVDETAQRGSVLTLYELTEGDATRGTEFHGLDKDLLLKALNTLVKRGKAQIFGQEDSQGIKFF
ncbi:ESCRT-II complex, vps25 subunit, partial [Coniella lustricola]